MALDEKARADLRRLRTELDAAVQTLGDVTRAMAAQVQRTDALEEIAITLRARVDALRGDVDTFHPRTPPPPEEETGPTVRVRKDDNLQAALTSLRGPTLLLVEPATYTGNFIVPRLALDSGWITMRPDVSQGTITPSSAEGWITPEFSPALVKLQSPNRGPALTCADGAQRIWLTGVEALPNTANDVDLFVFGRSDATSLEQLPLDIVIDRCCLRGDPQRGQHRGLAFHVRNGTVTGSYFADFFEPGRDSQAIAAWNAPGPFLLEQSYLEAASENVLFGGSDATIDKVLPADIHMRGCFLRNNPAWKGQARQVKNLFEVKAGRDVLVEACVFDECWPDAQSGDGVVISVRNQDGGNPWNTIMNMTLRYCLLKNIQGAGVQVLGVDDHVCDWGPWQGKVPPTIHGTNLTLEHCLLLKVDNGLKLNKTFRPTTIRHCTQPTVKNWALQFSGPPQPDAFVYEHNVTASGEYGFTGDGTPVGRGSLDAHVPGWRMANNVFSRAPYVAYPGGNTVLDSDAFTARLDVKGRYKGPETDDDGVPVGCDVDGLAGRIPWAKW